MASLLKPCRYWTELETEHREWLLHFDLRCLRNWEKLRNGDREAALCEAATRRLLQTQDIVVEPNEDLDGKAPNGLSGVPTFAALASSRMACSLLR